ncbi:hypothetical protein G6F57_019047 [Rhizopus arrhizus]|nr:hypothetical protein G6F57_019047 [Rhizopus arrhizus]
MPAAAVVPAAGRQPHDLQRHHADAGQRPALPVGNRPMPALLSSPPTPGSCPDAIAVAPSPAGAAGPDRRDGGDLPDRHRHRLRRCSGVFLRGGHPGRLARAGRPWADHAGPCLHRADRSELLPDPLRHLPYRPGQFGDRHAGDRHHHLSGPEHGSGQGGGAGGPGTIAAGRARVNPVPRPASAGWRRTRRTWTRHGRPWPASWPMRTAPAT